MSYRADILELNTEVVNAQGVLSDKEKIIYEFLILNNEKDAEIKISQWLKYLDKYPLEVIEFAFDDFNKNRLHSEQPNISNILRRIHIPEVENSEKQQEQRKRKSASVYSQMLIDYVHNKLKISFSDFVSSKNITSARKNKVLDAVDMEFEKKYGHGTDQEWRGEL